MKNSRIGRTPRMYLPEASLTEARDRLAAFTERPVVAFSIGASEDEKQWGADRFAALAGELAQRGFASLPLGGPAEAEHGPMLSETAPEERRREDIALRRRILAPPCT